MNPAHLRHLHEDGHVLAPPSRPGALSRRHVGHAHFWERALSRRQVLGGALGTTLALAGGSLLHPTLAGAAPGLGSAPKPIPGGLDLGGGQIIHTYFPYFGQEVSTITDFSGLVAAAEMQGGGTATDTSTGQRTRLAFDADMRVMQGRYMGFDGQAHQGTFGFI